MRTKYPLPKTDNLFDQLQDACVFINDVGH